MHNIFLRAATFTPGTCVCSLHTSGTGGTSSGTSVFCFFCGRADCFVFDFVGAAWLPPCCLVPTPERADVLAAAVFTCSATFRCLVWAALLAPEQSGLLTVLLTPPVVAAACWTEAMSRRGLTEGFQTCILACSRLLRAGSRPAALCAGPAC